METKSVLYIIVAAVLIIALQSARDVAIEFIKSTIEPVPAAMPGMFMIPPQSYPSQQQLSPYGGKNFAESSI